jgi:hypothetical protein
MQQQQQQQQQQEQEQKQNSEQPCREAISNMTATMQSLVQCYTTGNVRTSIPMASKAGCLQMWQASKAPHLQMPSMHVHMLRQPKTY